MMQVRAIVIRRANMKPYPSFPTVPRYYLSLNISETVKDTAIDAVEDE